MSLRRKVVQGSGVIMGGQVLGQGMSFVRNIIVARLISTDDFGIASTFFISISLFEMISNLSVDRLLVQAEDGDDPQFQATAQAFQVLRGAANALLMFLLAWPFSRLFGIPQALWAFQCIALVPLIRGFVHLDPKRLHREMRFGRDVLSELLSQTFALALAWPLAKWFGNYAAVLWLLVGQSLMMVFVSHVTAVRRYAWAWDRAFLLRMAKFGWPLLLNGVLMFLIWQGDRILVGSAYDMTQLALYSVAMTVTATPTDLLSRASSVVLLPPLARAQDYAERFAELYGFLAQALSLGGIIVAVFFIILGPGLVELLYGARYVGVGPFIGWFAVMQMLRLIRTVPTTAALAKGDTVACFTGNVARAACIPVLVILATSTRPLVWLAVAGCLGEVVALGTILIRMWVRHGLASNIAIIPAIFSVCAAMFAGAATLVTKQGFGLGRLFALCGVLVTSLLGALLFFPHLRFHLFGLLRKPTLLSARTDSKQQGL
ncbi:MAG TPA: oligosaccharide flippase family protein [Candidatus Hydrogenedentes bacterium]|nr:oligosaccharide flippase family protein [Candidatus Hydrogenedentota bacterium]HPJ98863.1 oligosaccharide flippase family protein [Candidatus Hydrogenedentota bacterium]